MNNLFTVFTATCILLTALPGLTQNRQIIDSLKAELHDVPDTSDTKNLYNIAHEYFHFGIHTDSVEGYADQILDIANRYQHKTSQIRGTFLKGEIAFNKQDIGLAKLYMDRTYELLDSTQPWFWHTMVPNALGVIHTRIDDPETALKYYFEAIKWAEKMERNEVLSPTYSNIAILLANMEDMDQGFAYFHKSLRAARAARKQVSELKTMYSMVGAFTHTQQWDSVEIYASQCLAKSRQLGYKEGEIRAKKQLAELYLFTKNYSLSESYARQVIVEETSQGGIYRRMPAYRTLAACYAARGQGQKAQIAVDTVLNMLDRIPEQIYRTDAYEELRDVYKTLGDYKTALSYQMQSTQIRDSLFGEDEKAKIRIMQQIYETEKTQRKLAELELENEKQAFQIKRRTYFLLGLGILFLLALLTAYLLFQRRMYKAREKISDAEQRLLRLQMNPHFLFNVLSSIQNYLFDKADTKKAILYLSKFSHLMRQVLEYSRETYIPLEDEVRTLENYLSLQQLRFDQQFDFEISISPDLNPWEIHIPPLMAQPFVENSIEHGKVHLQENGKIWIRFEKKEGKINLSVEDNGVGRPKTQEIQYKENHKSLATLITKDRIEVLSSLSKKKFTFHIIDLPIGGTKVEFGLPIIQNV